MKYFIYRLEITDGEHGYFSSSVCEARNMKSAINKANESAKNWHEPMARDSRTNITSEGNPYQVWEHEYGCVICQVDQVEEIPAEDYRVLSKYWGYL